MNGLRWGELPLSAKIVRGLCFPFFSVMNWCWFCTQAITTLDLYVRRVKFKHWRKGMPLHRQLLQDWACRKSWDDYL